ncbi:NAD(P)H-hydrate dehydratase [Enterococcus sp. LJL99]
MKKITINSLAKIIKQRPENSHKGTFGRVVLIGGNEQMGGAILMSAEATIRSGAGLTTIVTATKNHSSIHARLPEAMVLDWQDEKQLHEILKTADVILIGPGLGLEKQSRELLTRVIASQKQNQWLILDGSAITLYAETSRLLNYAEQVVFTPHQMEWERLSGIKIEQQTKKRNEQAQRKLNSYIVLKSHRTEIYTHTEIYKNTVGTPAMATGGMGDTLAGMIAGFLAQFQDKEAAICAAVYLHSLIGEILGKKQYVVLPTELSHEIPFFMKRFEQQERLE